MVGPVVLYYADALDVGASVKPTPAQRIVVSTPKPKVSCLESWWTKYASGPRDGAGLNAEAWQRHPGTPNDSPLLKIWTQE